MNGMQELWLEIRHIWTFCIHFNRSWVRRKSRPIHKIRSSPIQSIVVVSNKSPVCPAQLKICPSSPRPSPEILSKFWVQSGPHGLGRWAGLDSEKVTHCSSILCKRAWISDFLLQNDMKWNETLGRSTLKKSKMFASLQWLLLFSLSEEHNTG